jgi:hypothetical protein
MPDHPTRQNQDIENQLGAGAHACNPGYLEGRGQEGSLGKEITRSHLWQQMLGVVVLTCHPSYAASINTRITFRPAKPYSKKN